jgi:hypothetical protein
MSPCTLLAILVLFGGLLGCSPARVVESVRVLQDIQAGSGPSSLKRATAVPSRTAIVFDVEGRLRAADLYRPGDRPARGAVVLVPGVTPRGRDDPRVVEFANTLARAEFQVLVPDLPRMRALRVTADDAVPIADAVAFSVRSAGDVPVGVAAVSFAVGPAILSLFEPQAADRVDFVLGIGGYYDIEGLVTYITTGYYREPGDETWRFRPPKTYGKWVFVLSNTARIEDLADREALTTMAERKLDDADADIAELVAGLGPEGRSVYALLDNDDHVRVPALLAALPAAVVDEARALDLERRELDGLEAAFVLIHDRNDRIIPAAHAVALAAAVRRADVYLVDSLDHATPRPPNPIDAIRLLDAIYTVLRFRDRND